MLLSSFIVLHLLNHILEVFNIKQKKVPLNFYFEHWCTYGFCCACCALNSWGIYNLSFLLVPDRVFLFEQYFCVAEGILGKPLWDLVPIPGPGPGPVVDLDRTWTVPGPLWDLVPPPSPGPPPLLVTIPLWEWGKGNMLAGHVVHWKYFYACVSDTLVVLQMSFRCGRGMPFLSHLIRSSKSTLWSRPLSN